MPRLPATGPRLRSERNRIAALWLVLLVLFSVYTVLLERSVAHAAAQLAVHLSVLDGKADAPIQYQMYVHDRLLAGITRWTGSPDAEALAISYTLYYGVGLALFVVLLFRLCLRVGSTTHALLASFYFVAVLPVFWYDNFYHPGDPWGAALMVLLLESVFDGRLGARYFGLLLISGFVWEKHVLLPLSVGLCAALEARHLRWRVVAEAALGLGAAAAGQIALRLVFGTDRGWEGWSLAQNIESFPLWACGLILVFGPSLLYLATHTRRTPLILLCLAAQLPGWVAIYLVFGGVLKEMRTVLVMVPCTWPIFVLAVDQWFDRDSQSA